MSYFLGFKAEGSEKKIPGQNVAIQVRNHVALLPVMNFFLFTARKRSLRRLCFYTCLSVILFTGGEVPGQVHPPGRYTPLGRYTPPRAGTPPDRYPPWAGTLPWQAHPQGRYTPWQIHQPPEQCMLGDTGNKRAVRILLECILVFINFTHKVFWNRMGQGIAILQFKKIRLTFCGHTFTNIFYVNG